jgi:hypothetical protein
MWVQIPPGTMDIFSFEETILLAYRTSVVLLRCPLVPEIMQGLPSPVIVGNVTFYSIEATKQILVIKKSNTSNTSNKKSFFIHIINLYM